MEIWIFVLKRLTEQVLLEDQLRSLRQALHIIVTLDYIQAITDFLLSVCGHLSGDVLIVVITTGTR